MTNPWYMFIFHLLFLLFFVDYPRTMFVYHACIIPYTTFHLCKALGIVETFDLGHSPLNFLLLIVAWEVFKGLFTRN